MDNVIKFEVITNSRGATFIHGSECEGRMYLGSERLATDPDDRDLTGAFRQFGLPTAVAPGEWPSAHEGITTDEDPRHRG